MQPVLDYNYLAESFDRERLRESIRYCLKIAEQPMYANIIQERVAPADEELASDDALDEYMTHDVCTSHHSSGTCKMGPSSDRMAVVDQHGRVYGVEGLRVVDASIMPDCIRANTNVTTMMIGEKLAADMAAGR
jgi:choline dehydrogenase